jgi:hypothetical protein
MANDQTTDDTNSLMDMMKNSELGMIGPGIRPAPGKSLSGLIVHPHHLQPLVSHGFYRTHLTIN